ncbi:hypothetical protein T440DRAFT_473499 [Plenodomus tracheiphilus IPT5]|uniref:BZIP domain-containing protein n=1 Tax=Plenodomus tracheiphilus IPT5 TaxID=1408161 RepID=A0A6A7AMN9_9PLEO|nr:hypothetical protein T440DRAFT_473499 [Plenodomus tracheiphilus IPT5]
MTSTITPMQSHAGFPFYDPEFSTQVSSEAPNFYGPQAGWASALRGGKSATPATDYLIFPGSDTPPPEDDIQLSPPDLQDGSSKRPRKDSHTIAAQAPTMYIAPSVQVGGSQVPAYQTNTTPPMFSSASMFTASNTMTTNRTTATISPLQTRFNMDGDNATYNDPFSSQTQSWALDAQDTMSFSTGYHDPSVKRHSESPQARHGQSSPVTSHSSGGRRRRHENAEPGSARAIYLEKNRKAASKCRSKQKMQQDDLVETARDVERRNRMLKAEVDMLKGGVQELMEIVGQHTDGRLRAYVQREADRLAAGASRTPFVPSLPYTGSTSSAGVNGSPTATSSSRSRS